MLPRELSSLAMLRWHDGYNAAGGGFTGFLIGAVAASLLVLGFRREDRTGA
jgi:multisubunit Na+/H+ antiporter MnhB subunit